MDWFWCWNGEAFGYRQFGRLFAYHGSLVGRFYDDLIFGLDGFYLGEVKDGNRLVRHMGRTQWVRTCKLRARQSWSYPQPRPYIAFAPYTGYEDFPSPEIFRFTEAARTVAHA